MFKYNEVKSEAERIKRDFPIINYFHGLVNSGLLKYEGIQGKEHFFGFLSQRTGSIAVDDQANVWYDHSAGRGGDIIEAVQVFENMTFPQSIQRLAGSIPTNIIPPKKKTQTAPKIEIDGINTISHPALVNYIRSRGLEPNEILAFAKEIHWKNKGKSYFAVGFPNESAGWVLRSSIFKGNILGGGISIQILGKPKRIKVFEGWFDFLSYLKLSEASDFKAIILNSTANLSFRLILDILKEKENIDLYLDNDVTGENFTISFIKIAQLYHYCHENKLTTDWNLNALKGNRDKIGKLIDNLGINPSEEKQIWKVTTDISDQRSFFKGFKDVNDFSLNNPNI
ncbi:toprim domain-containing protein [Algoriphagus vanfongensis]|uniref:toprim domain-containing protein n=1 Tax=Algoriphagus vanfongensis TaxID=426371 RepID=UPI00047B7551|nr:toprim domain-containing protein [Algoriphagus vanfongensis]